MSQSMTDAGESTEFVQQGYGEKEPYWDKDIKWFQFPDDSEYHTYRLVGKPFYFALHWISSKKKDGTAGKSFSKLCKNYDSVSNRFAENGCRLCAFKDLVAQQLSLAKIKGKDWPDWAKRISAKTTMASNAIVREIQQNGAPANNAAGWTFLQPVKFPEGFSNTIKDTTDKLNKIAGKVYGFNHKDYGKDLLIAFNSQSKEPAKMYQLQLGEKTPLTPEELAHAKYLVDFQVELGKTGYPKDENCEKDLTKNGYYDLLESLNASHNLKQIQQNAPAETPVVAPQAPAQQAVAPTPAPVAPAAVTAAQAAAFDTPADGGMAATTGGELKAEAAPAASAEPQPPVFNANEPMPNFAPAPAPAPVVQPAAPSVPQAAAPQPVTPAPAPAPQPVAQVAVPAPAPASQDLLGKISTFASSAGLTLAPHDKEYPDVMNFKRGMTVPTCFTKYTVTMPTKICTRCPMRLDCMIADGA